MLSCYGDESADKTRQRVFVVAGVIGNDNQWNWLEPRWIARTNGAPFHANNCDSDKGDYATMPHEENKSLYKDLTILLASSGLVGFGFATDLIAQRAVFPNAPDFAYYKGFLEVLDRMYNLCAKHDESVRFRFDTRLESEHNASLLYGQALEAMPEWKRRFFPEVEFVNSRENPRVQVADLMAREAMKVLDNIIGPVKRPVRQSWQTLSQTGRFLVDVISKEWFEDLRSKLPDARKASGMEEEKYHQWLQANSRQHNMTNLLVWMHITAMNERRQRE